VPVLSADDLDALPEEMPLTEGTALGRIGGALDARLAAAEGTAGALVAALVAADPHLFGASDGGNEDNDAAARGGNCWTLADALARLATVTTAATADAVAATAAATAADAATAPATSAVTPPRRPSSPPPPRGGWARPGGGCASRPPTTSK